MLKIYGADLSTSSNKVRFVANLLNIEYDYVRVKVKDGETRTAEYLRMHPAGKVPVIEDDGFVLFESNSICRYLCHKKQSGLYPQELKPRSLVDQWLDFVSIHIGGAINKVAFNRLFAPIIPVEVDKRSEQDGVNFFNRFLPAVENSLKHHPYLPGDTISLADINLLATLDPVELAKLDITPYSRLVAWRNKLRQQEFYTKCYEEYGETYKRMISSGKKQ